MYAMMHRGRSSARPLWRSAEALCLPVGGQPHGPSVTRGRVEVRVPITWPIIVGRRISVGTVHELAGSGLDGRRRGNKAVWPL